MCLGIAGDLGIILGAFAMIVGAIFAVFAFVCGSRINGGYERIK